jgi:hypothetical protein
LLLASRRTAHSRFKIPLQVDDNSFCDIKRGTNLSNLLKESALIIWDEALMTGRKCFEALDRTLRDVLSVDDPLLADVPFGGKVIVLGGDLRQILPVIEGGSRPQIIDAAKRKQETFSLFFVLQRSDSYKAPGRVYPMYHVSSFA